MTSLDLLALDARQLSDDQLDQTAGGLLMLLLFLGGVAAGAATGYIVDSCFN